MKNKRWRLFADYQVQGGLCVRLAIYWLICQLAMMMTMFAMDWLAPESQMGARGLIFPGFVVSSICLPLAMFDLIAFSNRFAGPVMNFRRHFGKLVNREALEEIKFRPGDYYYDLMENFNDLAKQIADVKPAKSEANQDEMVEA